MVVSVSICFLVVISTFELLAGADPIWTNIAGGTHKKTIEDDDNVMEGHHTLEMNRMEKEYAMFKKGLTMENDEGELVELTTSTGHGVFTMEVDSTSNLDNRVFYRLYTRNNPEEYQPISINDESSLSRSNFNADKPTYFVTHGWHTSGNGPSCTEIRNAYLQNGDFNVIVVDWSSISMEWYNVAASYVTMVGQHVASMIDYLQSNARLNTKTTTLVGHSLGAHVMGLAGYHSKGTINCVVGLDPALPLFYFAGVGERISNEDANHVQIIHTNAGLLGYESAIGHADFYPNGGSVQPGCLTDVTDGACSHSRSWKFFAESMNSNIRFYGTFCTSYISYVFRRCSNEQTTIMGGPMIDQAAFGAYYLSTSATAPFAKKW